MSLSKKIDQIISDYIESYQIIPQLENMSGSFQSKHIRLDQVDHIRYSRANYTKKSGEGEY